MSNVPEGNDSEFTWESFRGQVNKDLSDVLGNFVSRVTKFCNAKFRDEQDRLFVPDGNHYRETEENLINLLCKRIAVYERHLKDMELRKAIRELRYIWVLGNEYLQDRAPWVLYKDNAKHEEVNEVIRFALSLIVLYANLSEPFIPDTAKKIHKAMRTNPSWPTSNFVDFELLPAGHEFTVPENLFEKITDDQIAELSARFSGES